jgi:hypothetical protein
LAKTVEDKDEDVVGHSPHHPKVKGLSPAAAGIKKITNMPTYLGHLYK